MNVMAQPLLSVNSLSVHIGQKPLLNNIRFSLGAGEVLAILGENGAGKSTLLKQIIDENQYKVSGDSFFCGQSIASIPAEDRARKIALLSQTMQLQFPFTVEEVVRLGRTPHSSSKAQNDLIVQAQLERFDIVHLKDEIYTHLSGGEKQRVHLARVLSQLSGASESSAEAMPPRLLLLDEPCNALDVQHQQQLLSIIKNLREEHIAVVIVAHNINWVSQCADRFVALKKGEVLAEGVANEVLIPEVLEKIYSVKADVIEHPSSQQPFIIFTGTSD